MTPSRRAAESATSPLLTKAAEEAAKEYVKMNADRLEVKYDHEFVYTPDQRERFAIEVQEIILRHLAPVQKEMKEAHIFIKGYIEALEVIIEVMPETDEKVRRFRALIAKAQAWLARNPEGVGV